MGPTPTPAQKAAIPDYGMSGDALWNAGTGEPRFDANYTFAGIEKAFTGWGSSISEATPSSTCRPERLSIVSTLSGTVCMHRNWASATTGVLRRSFRIAADLYNPGDVALEFKGIFNVNESLGLYAGFANSLVGPKKDVLSVCIITSKLNENELAFDVMFRHFNAETGSITRRHR